MLLLVFVLRFLVFIRRRRLLARRGIVRGLGILPRRRGRRSGTRRRSLGPRLYLGRRGRSLSRVRRRRGLRIWRGPFSWTRWNCGLRIRKGFLFWPRGGLYRRLSRGP